MVNAEVLPKAEIVALAADPARFVMVACERAKAWLAEALEHGNIDRIIELKSRAEAIRVYTMQKQLGKDAELSAAEIVRRAERGIGLAIRKGRAEGKILKTGQHAVGNDYGRKPAREVVGSKHRSEIVEMTKLADSVTDERFDEAIEEAKAEKNLSRANVVRKIRGANGSVLTSAKIAGLARGGHTSEQIADSLDLTVKAVRENARRNRIQITADRVIGKTRRLDSNRIIREIVGSLETIETTIELVDFSALDRNEIGRWLASLARSIRLVDRLRRRLEEQR